MTLTSSRPDAIAGSTSSLAPAQRVGGTTWVPRPFAALLTDQLDALAAFQERRRAVESAVDEPGMSREQRLDARRRLDVLRRQHEAILVATSRSMEASGGVMHAVGPRALLVHRNEWLRRRVAQDLERSGVQVVGQLDNGADGVGVLVAEQPDLLLVEDTLPMVSGLQVLQEARRYAPRTLLAAQVGYDDQVADAVDAGAVATFTRRIPPADIGAALARLVCA